MTSLSEYKILTYNWLSITWLKMKSNYYINKYHKSKVSYSVPASSCIWLGNKCTFRKLQIRRILLRHIREIRICHVDFYRICFVFTVDRTLRRAFYTLHSCIRPPFPDKHARKSHDARKSRDPSQSRTPRGAGVFSGAIRWRSSKRLQQILDQPV